MRLWPRQIEPSTTDGDVLTTVAGVAVWSTPSTATPLFADDDASAVVADDGSDYLYPDP